jgi:hypothetical protein
VSQGSTIVSFEVRPCDVPQIAMAVWKPGPNRDRRFWLFSVLAFANSTQDPNSRTAEQQCLRFRSLFPLLKKSPWAESETEALSKERLLDFSVHICTVQVLASAPSHPFFQILEPLHSASDSLCGSFWEGASFRRLWFFRGG